MRNADIREHAKQNGVYLWQVAMKLGVNDGNLSRRLRVELPDEDKQKIRNIIDEIANS